MNDRAVAYRNWSDQANCTTSSINEIQVRRTFRLDKENHVRSRTEVDVFARQECFVESAEPGVDPTDFESVESE